MSVTVPTPMTPAIPMPPDSVIPPEFRPRYEDLVTEDGAPVDGIYSEKQIRLLTEPLYATWPGPGEDRPFLALANVGLFYGDLVPPVVPDVFLSLDVAAPADLLRKENRSYFLWRYLKAPEIAIEIVSNKEGGEADTKLGVYRKIGIDHYVIWDPEDLLKGGRLRALVLDNKKYQPLKELWFPAIDLGLTLWSGEFERSTQEWLRWCDRNGKVIPTGGERAARLEARLRALGIDPNGA